MSVFDLISGADWAQTVDEFKRYHVHRMLLNPLQWSRYPNRIKGLEWRRVRLDASGIKSLPDDKKGVYTFVLEPQLANHSAVGYLLYVGEAHNQSLRQRCATYLGELTAKKPRVHIREMLRKWPNHLWIHFAVVTDQSKIILLEEELIAAYLPPYNRRFPATVRNRMKAVFS